MWAQIDEFSGIFINAFINISNLIDKIKLFLLDGGVQSKN